MQLFVIYILALRWSRIQGQRTTDDCYPHETFMRGSNGDLMNQVQSRFRRMSFDLRIMNEVAAQRCLASMETAMDKHIKGTAERLGNFEMGLTSLTEETTLRLEQISGEMGHDRTKGSAGDNGIPGSKATLPVPPVCFAGPFGGIGGSTLFDDFYVSMNGPITSILTKSDWFIDSIRVKYGTTWGPINGESTAPSSSVFDLRDGEVIKRVEMRKRLNGDENYVLCGLKFVTNQRSSAWHGSSSGSSDSASGGRLRHIAGKHGSYLDSITLYFDAC
ncbi:hypothetical protein CAPTEDRAFT_201017 [Capitella teleta]|uniref:Jacalin-type lectin domain-containing protein n=1 Tax=Capitella teleta TaxID=283909 RepID=R7UAZ7_CAPTE|nr:hypothetical protein CAPTEDRAFT_201017 [Capitella teleta]|eukprot:ELU03530.1 hypothetical protein CAPTEDRAFT_201017 [Capitella teleta]